MKKILCLTDFSKAATNAAQYGAWLSRESGAELYLLHVVQTQALLHGMPSPQKAQEVDRKLAEAEQKLAELKQVLQADTEASDRDLKCRTYSGEGLLRDVVEYYCEQYDIDLVLMGTTGGSADTLYDLLVGSNTVELFEKLRWPVMSIPVAYHQRELRHVLFATDYQPKDQAACQEVLTLMAPFCAQLHLLHVSTTDSSQEEEQLIGFARSLITGCGHDHLHFSRVTDPDIEHGVLSYAEEIETDMLVLTGKETGFLSWFFRQSLTELAAYHVQFPLLVFPAAWKPGARMFNRAPQTQTN